MSQRNGYCCKAGGMKPGTVDDSWAYLVNYLSRMIRFSARNGVDVLLI